MYLSLFQLAPKFLSYSCNSFAMWMAPNTLVPEKDSLKDSNSHESIRQMKVFESMRLTEFCAPLCTDQCKGTSNAMKGMECVESLKGGLPGVVSVQPSRADVTATAGPTERL